MKWRLVFLGGLVCAIVLGAWVPTLASSSTCSASGFTAYGDCYLELTGCEAGSCDYNAGTGGEGWVEGTNCTGYYGSCSGNWYMELSQCTGDAGFYCRVDNFGLPLIN